MTISIAPLRLAALADRLACVACGCALVQFSLVDAYFGVLMAGLAGGLAGFACGAVMFGTNTRRAR